MTASTHDRRAALDTAADHLEKAGFRLLDRDWHDGNEVLDIVAAERHVFIVCEVKIRSRTGYRAPLEAVSRAKRGRLRTLAVRWMNGHGVRFDQVRIDVVGVVYEGSGGFTIEHIRAVG
jgi:putative endonuclease